MFTVLNCLRGIFLLWILAALFYLSAGLECYYCTATTDPTAPLDFGLFEFASGTPPLPTNVHCHSPHYTWQPYYPAIGNQTCNSTQPTCEKSTRIFNYTFLSGSQWITREYYNVVYRKCSSKPLPPKGQQCFNVSENVTREGIDPIKSPNYVSFDGVTCLCDTDTCNDQPGLEDKDNDLSWVYVPTEPTTPKEETTTPHPHSAQNENEGNNIQNSFPASAWFILCFWLCYF